MPRESQAPHAEYANSIIRHNTEHKRARRGTLPIDDNLLARVAKRHIARPVGADVATEIVSNADTAVAVCESAPRNIAPENKMTVHWRVQAKHLHRQAANRTL